MIQQVVVTEIDNIKKFYSPPPYKKYFKPERRGMFYVLSHTKTYFFRNRYTYVPSLNTPIPTFFLCVLF